MLLASWKEYYMKEQLNIFEQKDTVLYTNISVSVQRLFDLASLHSSLAVSSFPLNNDEVADLRSTRIDLVQGNTKTINNPNNWTVLCLRRLGR